MQHFNVPAASFDRGRLRRRPDVRRLVDPRLPGDPRVGHEADPGPGDRVRRPVPGGQDARHQLLHRRPVHRRAVQPRPAQHRRQGRGVPEGDRHRRHRVLRRPRPSSTSSTTCGSRPSRTPATTTSTPIEGAWNTGASRGGRQPRLQAALQGRLLPGRRRPTTSPTCATRWSTELAASASRSSARTTRWAPPARPRSTTGSTRCCTPADTLMLFKYIIKNVAWTHGKTATFMPKPLFGDNGSGMHCHQSLWKDGEPLFYDESATAGCPTWPAGTSAACSSTRRRCWRSPTRR